MPYVQLIDGVVIGAYALPQPGYAEEFRDEDSSEVIAFRAVATPENDPPPSAAQIRAALIAAGNTDVQVDALFALAATVSI